MEGGPPLTQNEGEGLLGERFQGRFLLTKDVELYFPMYQLTGEPILKPAAKTLKLVVLQSDDANVRAEGGWDVSILETK
jgi:hypothetical protein